MNLQPLSGSTYAPPQSELGHGATISDFQDASLLKESSTDSPGALNGLDLRPERLLYGNKLLGDITHYLPTPTAGAVGPLTGEGGSVASSEGFLPSNTVEGSFSVVPYTPAERTNNTESSGYTAPQDRRSPLRDFFSRFFSRDSEKPGLLTNLFRNLADRLDIFKINWGGFRVTPE